VSRQSIGRKHVGAAAAAAALLVVGIAALSSSDRSEFWERLKIGGWEVETFSSMSDMVRASDSVVLARIGGVDVSRTIQGDAPEDVVTYARLDLEVLQVISGTSPDRVPLEFLVGAIPGQVAAEIEALRQAIPKEPAVFFLHAKRGNDEHGLYRLIASTGLFAATSRSTLEAPLRDDAPFSVELRAVGSVESLVDYLESLAAQTR